MHDGSSPTVPAWQRAAYVTRPQELLAQLQLDPALPGLELARCRDFPLRVPQGFVARMRKGDPQDPLFLQVWPGAAESVERPGFAPDAVGDLAALRPGGVVHKYQGRVLLLATGACAVHCRYCFRRHFPYAEALAARNHWQEALAQIAADPSVSEVILSGGDPLSLSDERLAGLTRGLAGLPQVRRLRLHTRTAVVLPERVDAGFLAWLAGVRLPVTVVLHVNHPNELDGAAAGAIARLRGAGATLLAQSVLLKGVNDTTDVLEALSERLFACGVLPYYLHLLDRVRGAGHFEVSQSAAIQLMQDLSSRLPGYLVPRLAREVPGAPGKQLLSW
ncbi:MAG: EF-P beta-lysylation protein EpmB [Nevskia sp.]|nr:EF-P beta-lysylation protein EpmB [Nevskia sp.]